MKSRKLRDKNTAVYNEEIRPLMTQIIKTVVHSMLFKEIPDEEEAADYRK